VLYINAGPPTGKYILQHCIGLNIPEPQGVLLAGESVEFEKENHSYIHVRKDTLILVSTGLTHFP
jgi:hypothetical protein